MKKKMVLTIACLLTLIVAACSNDSTPQATTPNSVQLHITNNTNASIYGMEISWEQDGVVKGTQGGINADGSKMKKGEPLVFELLPDEVDSTKDMLVEVSLITSLDPNTTVPLDAKTPIKLSGNGDYFYELVSDAEGIRLVKSEE